MADKYEKSEEDRTAVSKFIELENIEYAGSRNLIINIDAITYIDLEPKNVYGRYLYAIRMRDENDIYVTEQDLWRIKDLIAER